MFLEIWYFFCFFAACCYHYHWCKYHQWLWICCKISSPNSMSSLLHVLEYEFVFLCFLLLYKFLVLFGFSVSAANVSSKHAFVGNVDDCFKVKWWKLIYAWVITLWNDFWQINICISISKVYCCFMERNTIVVCTMRVIQTFRSIQQGQTFDNFWHSDIFVAKQSVFISKTHLHLYLD